MRAPHRGHVYFGAEIWQMPHKDVSSGSDIMKRMYVRKELVEGKIYALRPHAQLQLRETFLWVHVLSYRGHVGSRTCTCADFENLMQITLKSPQGYNGFEVESQVVRPVGE